MEILYFPLTIFLDRGFFILLSSFILQYTPIDFLSYYLSFIFFSRSRQSMTANEDHYRDKE
jgi:hypothetical protein